ncbi:hypothetical protein CEXT_538171 [Caerostris extrusa]|uniref:Uncharacterized protein n=1 Tax=Caerostris extrusa TaxID=172846 RepID=A0AAV4RE10_CAEEX|nr:hypothetical protein CEXT_538171 [Caerostris extrusa]
MRTIFIQPQWPITMQIVLQFPSCTALSPNTIESKEYCVTHFIFSRTISFLLENPSFEGNQVIHFNLSTPPPYFPERIFNSADSLNSFFSLSKNRIQFSRLNRLHE